MDRLSVCDAKARFSELAERAQSGRSTVITKRGRVVAKIVPTRVRGRDRSAALDDAEKLRTSLRVSKRVNLGKLIGDGRL